MNLNGHLSSNDVSSTGEIDSSFFEVKTDRPKTALDAQAFGNVLITQGVISLAGSFNVESVQLNSTGFFTMTLGFPQQSEYIVVATVSTSENDTAPRVAQVVNQTPTSFQLLFTNITLTPTTPIGFSFVVFRMF